MNNNWFCKRQLLLTTISALFVLTLVAFAPSPAAADTPAWLRSAAHETYPNAPPDTQAIVLIDEQETTVQSNGSVETTFRRAYLILRPSGKKFGIVTVPFDNETRITWVKAWCIPKDGKDYEVKEKDFLEVGATEEFYSDNRMKAVEIPAATPGNVVGYEYHQKSRPFILQDEWHLQFEVPVRRSRFTLSLPSGWDYTAHWMNYPEQKPISDSATLISWEIENIPGIKKERSMPNPRAVLARMGVTYHPPKDKGSALGPTNWNQIGVWYAQLSSGSIQPTQEIQQKVKETHG